MEIKRDQYLNKLIASQNNRMIKIITGIRRCGKSYLLFKIFKNYLISQGIKKENIITLALDDEKNSRYRDCKVLYEYLREKIKDKRKKYFIFLDEIQLAITKEELNKNYDKYVKLYGVLNGLLHLDNVDVYVTGSNSKLLSKDVLTEFRGRGDEIRVYPLSFAEFYSAKKKKFDVYKAWDEYCLYGGLPDVTLQENIEKKSDYLKYQATNIYLNDIIERYRIKNKDILETLIEIISSNVGSLTNPVRLANTFNTELKISVTDKTISTYLDHLEDAFLIQKTKRYDVKGNRYIGTPLKYYYTDIGIRNSLINFRQDEQDHIMENVIYNELKIRGYSVDVGIVELNEKNKKNISQRKQLEVDFVCNKASKRFYIQAVFALPTREKTEQETKSLVNIKDSFKKIVVTKMPSPVWRNNDGILIMDIQEFLLNPNSLDL